VIERALTVIVSSLEDALPDMQVIFCDIWGVLHNGVAAFPAAGDALIRARKAGVAVILLSNAPRPGAVVLRQLDRLGVPRQAFDDIVTSGDVCRDIIAAWRPKRFVHLGPDRDKPIFEGLGVEPVPASEADYLLCTGLLDDTCETPEDYRARLAAFAIQDLPMLCANPDLVIDRGGREVYCKPLNPSDALMIGDSFRTDIAGANAFGAKSLFIAAGIHAPEFLNADGAIDQDKAGQSLSLQASRPDYLLSMLA
jgi:HAD superfamily hydrolase (TIGR01459 family)